MTIETDMALVINAIGIDAEARYSKRSAAACMFMGGMRDMEHSRLILAMRFPGERERRAAELLADQRSRALVRSAQGWNGITSVAAALLEHGQLDWYDDIEPLFQAAYDGREPDRNAVMDMWPWPMTMFQAGDVVERSSDVRDGITTWAS